MRTVAEIQVDLDAEIARHRREHKRLLRELSEARGVRYTPAKLQAIKADYLSGKTRAEIRSTHRLTRGQLAGLLERHKWRRPAPLRASTIYNKLRTYLKMPHAEALKEAQRLSAGTTERPSPALASPVGRQGPATLPTVAPALNSRSAG